MGIYIPGIEMPKGHNCVTITIWHSGDASYGLFDREGILSDFKCIKVVPVPPHGSLIEKHDVFKLITAFPEVDKLLPVEFMEALYNLPTIIPASEEEMK